MILKADYNADVACLEPKTSVNLFRDSAELISYLQTVNVPETPLAHAQSSAAPSPTASLLQDPTAQTAIAFCSLREIQPLPSVHAASQEPSSLSLPQFAMLLTTQFSNATAEVYSIVLLILHRKSVTALEQSPVELKTETTLISELTDNALV